MTPHIEFEGNGYAPVQGISFDNASSSFVIAAGLNNEFGCSVNYGYPKGKFSAVDGQILLLFNPDHSESDIRKVRIPGAGNNTVGWLCTIGALNSSAHSYADDKYFRSAAYVAAQLLLQTGEYIQSRSIQHGSTIQFADLFDQDASVLVLHRPSISAHVDITARTLLPCFHQFGFVPFIAGAAQRWQPGVVTRDTFAKAGSTITVRPIMEAVGFVDFIVRVFDELLPLASDTLLKFFIYYQVVEALLDIIFAHRQGDTILGMVTIRNDPVLLHPMIKKLTEDASENKRMNLLFNEYSGREGVMVDLCATCNTLLKTLGIKEELLAARALYEVRNIIFHNLRKLSPSSTNQMQKIVEQLEWAIPELLLEFRIPAAQELDFMI